MYITKSNGMPGGMTWKNHLVLLRKMSKMYEMHGVAQIYPSNAFAACVAIALSVATFIHGKKLEK